MKTYPLFINGEFRDSKDKKKVVDPATSEVFAEISIAKGDQVKSAVDSARAAFDYGPWRKASCKERKKALLKISQGILEHAAELAKLEALNSGKPIKETTFIDIPSSAETFKYFANNLERFLEEEKVTIESQIAAVDARLLREPRGVVLLIVPWNYPLLIASWKLAQSLAAGNTVVLKPSSLTPVSVSELAKIISVSGLPKGVVNIISGEGGAVGEALCSDKRVDMISFTGSNAVGRKILGYASGGAKKTIMELGGKSASIIFADADFETAVNGALSSIFLNQGQMCTAMSRIFVEESIYDKFIESFAEKAKRIKLGAALNFETQMGPLISEGQRRKVVACIEKAKKEGAKLICGGRIPCDQSLAKGFFFEPTALTEVSPQAAILQEEVFGPVACIDKFSHPKEAVELANKSAYALAGCIWTKNKSLAQSISRKIDAGTIWINTYGVFFDALPYGGFKQSGFGKELGRDGFLEYTRLKNVISDKTKSARPLVSYWYGF